MVFSSFFYGVFLLFLWCFPPVVVGLIIPNAHGGFRPTGTRSPNMPLVGEQVGGGNRVLKNIVLNS